MAGITPQASDVASSSQASESLRAIAQGQYDGDWERTKPEIKTAILSAVSMYQSRGQHRTRQSAPSPSEGPTQLSITEAASLPTAETRFSPTSPTTSTTQIQTDDPSDTNSSNGHNNSSPLIGPVLPGSGAGPSNDDRPSTPGGLVIPPFPPLDPGRRKRASSSTSSEGGKERASHILVSRPNGVGHPAPPIRIATGNVFEDEYDEDVVIGGKKRAGWMSEEDGQKEASRLVSVLDELDEPPFTVQRLAEILSDPTSTYASLGKFLRAVEKMILVQTPWLPQTYIPELENFLTSTSKTTYDPSLPPLMSTPKFSPIPWLHPHSEDGEGVEARMPGRSISPFDMTIVQEENAGQGPGETRLEGDGTETGANANAGEGRSIDQGTKPSRSERDESIPASIPGSEDVEMSSSSSETGPTTTTQVVPVVEQEPQPQPISGDPGNQPYLGRVDELDTGPIQSTPGLSGGTGNGSREDDHVVPGTGEGGTMTPHGMSEKPIPISSTTVISDEERRIAGLRQGQGQGQGLGQSSEDNKTKADPSET